MATCMFPQAGLPPPSPTAGVSVYPVVDRPIGPHPKPMFEAHIAPEQAGEVMQWLAERGASALVHPHTGDGFIDHTVNARWVGAPLPLVLDIFGAR
jgi:aromatic ring-cleaving dioxygenase